MNDEHNTRSHIKFVPGWIKLWRTRWFTIMFWKDGDNNILTFSLDISCKKECDELGLGGSGRAQCGIERKKSNLHF